MPCSKEIVLAWILSFFVIINLGRNYNWAAAHKKTSFHRTSGQTIPRRNRTFDLRCKRWFFFLLISILIFELWLYPCVRTFQGILGCCRRCHKRLQTSEPVTFPTFFVSLQPLAGSALKRKIRKKWSSWSETFPNRRETSQWWSRCSNQKHCQEFFSPLTTVLSTRLNSGAAFDVLAFQSDTRSGCSEQDKCSCYLGADGQATRHLHPSTDFVYFHIIPVKTYMEQCKALLHHVIQYNFFSNYIKQFCGASQSTNLLFCEPTLPLGSETKLCW